MTNEEKKLRLTVKKKIEQGVGEVSIQAAAKYLDLTVKEVLVLVDSRKLVARHANVGIGHDGRIQAAIFVSVASVKWYEELLKKR